MAKAVQYSSRIWIWEASKAYRSEVERVLARMKTTEAAKSLIKHIDSKPHWMLISPFKPTSKDPVNAYASARDNDAATPPGHVSRTIEVDLGAFGTIEIPVGFGTGGGSRVDISYHPATWHELYRRTGHIQPGAGAGELLFHEMIHGYRQQSGLLRYYDKVNGEVSMTSVEEFYAIVAANIYRSERGFTKLRKDHWWFKPIINGPKDSATYYQHYKEYIDKWFAEQKDFCLDLAKCKAKFNPFFEAAVALRHITRPAR